LRIVAPTAALLDGKVAADVAPDLLALDQSAVEIEDDPGSSFV
jgi:hypothetical protein